MTLRERTALTLVVLGALACSGAAYAYDGLRSMTAVLGLLGLVGGVLLGLGDEALSDDDGFDQ